MSICISIEQLDKLRRAKLVEVESLAGEAGLKPANIRAKLNRYRNGSQSCLTFPEAEALGKAFERLLARAGFTVSKINESDQTEGRATASSAPPTPREGDGSRDGSSGRRSRSGPKHKTLPKPDGGLYVPPRPQNKQRHQRLPGR